MEAPAGTACILLDSVSSPSQTGANSVSGDIPIYPGEPGSAFDTIFPEFSASASDVTLSNLVLTASTCPAVVAVQATLLNIHDNRIFMEDVASLWPALYVSGAEISIERNWIGLQDTAGRCQLRLGSGRLRPRRQLHRLHLQACRQRRNPDRRLLHRRYRCR